MNCRETEELTPLFVENDLDDAEMQQVSAHLAACVACGEIVTEFQASQALLHTAALPAFDEAMLSEMRNVVMQGIVEAAPRSVWAQWMQPLWNWKLAFAAATVLLLVAGIAFSRREAKPGKDQVAGKAKEPHTVASPRETLVINSASVPQPHQPRTGRKNKAQGAVSVSERNPGNNVRKQSSPERATDIDRQIAAAAIAPFGAENDAAIFPRGGTLSSILLPAPPAETTTQNPENSVPEPEMLRMEIHTADPHIKIIWLTPKEPTRTNAAPIIEATK